MFYISPLVRNLLILNVGFYFIHTISPLGLQLRDLMILKSPFTLFFDNVVGGTFNPAQLITYQFVHDNSDGGHLFSNMLGLFFFGPAIENFMGSKKFMIYYLLTGVGAAILHYVISYFMGGGGGSLLGASGAIFGILIAYGYLFPNNEMMVFLIPFPIKAKYLVSIYGISEIYSGINNVGNVAHFAHVGGLITGFILLRFFNFSKLFR